jgi:diaminopimelate epimerase
MLSYVKLTCAGNDFILLDGRDGLCEPPEELAKRLCARRLSLGADGLLVVEETGDLPPLGVTHFEPDGARTFCLNGVRGVAAWLVATGQHHSDEALALRTDAGDLDVMPGRFEVSVALPWPKTLERRSVALHDGTQALGCFVDVGNPQFVIVLDGLEALDTPGLMATARQIRWATGTFPEGANVTFVAPDVSHDRWQVRTYERGVEEETLACGTGVLAAACALVGAPYPEAVQRARTPARTGGGPRPSLPGGLELGFLTRGGHELSVSFPDGAGSRRVWTRGPVQLLAGGQLWG